MLNNTRMMTGYRFRIYLHTFVCMMTMSLSCESEWKAFKQFSYKEYRNRESFINAKQKCQFQSAELVMPKSEEELNFIDGEFNIDDHWIGLRNTGPDVNIPHFVWEDGSFLTFTPQDTKLNDDYSSGMDCVNMDRKNKWRPRSCTKQYRYICQKLSTLYDCPTDWNRSYTSYTCFKNIGYGTMKEARYRCSDLSETSAMLVMPKTVQENIYLSLLMSQWNEHITHIGLEGRAHGGSVGSWAWFDKESLVTTGFTDWTPGMPSYSDTHWTGIVYAAKQDQWVVSQSSTNTYCIVCQCYLPYYSTDQQQAVWQYSIDLYCTPPFPMNLITESLTKASVKYGVTSDMTTVTTEINTETTNTCHLECSCENVAIPSESELNKMITEIKANLTVDRATLSSTIRKLTCADDPRPSSRYIGFAGALLMSVPFAFLLMLDLLSLGKFLLG